MEEAKRRPTKPKWTKRSGEFVDTFVSDDRIVDVFFFDHRCCGSIVPYVTCSWGISGRDLIQFRRYAPDIEWTLNSRGNEFLRPLMEILYRENVIERKR
jgi:hypothetical protein